VNCGVSSKEGKGRGGRRFLLKPTNHRAGQCTANEKATRLTLDTLRAQHWEDEELSVPSDGQKHRLVPGAAFV
jgi:hypothetical protein